MTDFCLSSLLFLSAKSGPIGTNRRRGRFGKQGRRYHVVERGDGGGAERGVGEVRRLAVKELMLALKVKEVASSMKETEGREQHFLSQSKSRECGHQLEGHMTVYAIERDVGFIYFSCTR